MAADASIQPQWHVPNPSADPRSCSGDACVARRAAGWRALGMGAAFGCLALSSLCSVSHVAAQEVGGTLEGRVLDTAGSPMANVGIVLTGPSLQSKLATMSDERGRFQFALVPVGIYEVRVRLLGYREVVRPDLVVSLGHMTDLGDVRIASDAIPISGVSVTSERARSGGHPTAIGGNLASREYRVLPSDRDYQSIVTLLPHANVSYSGDRANISGTSGPESNYYVDGANVVEPPGNGMSTSLPYNFIREVEVRAGGYQAEYGGAGGGIVNAVTASGGNSFSGQVFGFAADRLFTSASGFQGVSSKTEDYQSWDAGGSVGGPIVRDRVWFLVGYDPAQDSEDIRLPDFGVRTDQRRIHRFAGKVTARIDDKTHLVLAALGDPWDRDQVGGLALSTVTALGNIDPMLGTQRGGGTNVSLLGTRTLGASSFLQLGAGVSQSRYAIGPSTSRGATEPLFIDARTGYVEGGFGSSTDRHAGRYSGRAAVTLGVHDHTLKVGASYDDEYFRERLSYDQLTRLADSLYQYVTLDDRGSHNHVRSPTVFVQDGWRVTRRLRLDVGVRWSQEVWLASGGEVGQRVSGPWQPRAGVAWSIGPHEATNLFASYGRYLQRTRLNVPGFFLQDEPSTYLIQRFDHDPRVDPSGGNTVFAQTLGHQAEVDDLKGAAFDEIQAGVEHALGDDWRVTTRALYRSQRSGVVGVSSPVTTQAVYGNPGRGELQPYPGITRIYRALEISMSRTGRNGSSIGASYLLSSLEGNYEGYWDQTAGVNDPIGGAAFAPSLAATTYASGPLPNDRTHQVKAFGSTPLAYGFAAGATVTWASGTPLSELGSTPLGAPYYVFLRPRGSLGRTPSIYDVSLRFAYEPVAFAGPLKPRVLADIYHVGNPRRPVVFDQVHYRGATQSGQQTAPNPNYGQPLYFQPAVAYRFGVEMSW
jgi:hypothetical protein